MFFIPKQDMLPSSRWGVMMIGNILFFFLVAIAALVFIASRKPDTFRVSRTAVFNAAPAAIFELVNDLTQWERWSPWSKMDPHAKVSFAGPNAGVGATMRWEGNNKVGTGMMTITESVPPSMVKLQLDFEKPMKGTSMSEFLFHPEGSQTQVTWSMQGRNNLMGKIMSLVLNCEKMVGEQYEKGFANIREIVEQQ